MASLVVTDGLGHAGGNSKEFITVNTELAPHPTVTRAAQAAANRAAKLALGALSLQPSSEKIHLDAGGVFLHVHELSYNISHSSAISALQQAVDVYSKAAQLAPYNLVAHQNLGSALLTLGIDKESVDTARSGVFHLSKLMQRRTNFASVKQPPQVVEHLVSLYGSITSQTEVHKFLKDAAISFSNRAVELLPRVGEVHMLKAHMHMERAEFESARQCLLRAVDLDQRDAGPRIALSDLHSRLGERDQALSVLHRARQEVQSDHRHVIEQHLNELSD
eukprot:TRINITY_DN20520_c0_g1_i1.p1 TRINITY_DN20520_c0_g1~~TRINITY_DN20520_c0_g1_i1.p1  ORF type:complete len:277 (+),score=61.89 TRINITY_DN20520_c0_g1_i1:273-1103(+)